MIGCSGYVMLGDVAAVGAAAAASVLSVSESLPSATVSLLRLRRCQCASLTLAELED